MASKRQCQEKRLSQSQSAYDLNSTVVRGRRQQEQQLQGQQTRRRPLSAAPPSSSTEFSPDREHLRSLRKLTSLPEIDSGALSLTSSTGDHAQELSSKGAVLIHGLSEAIKSGEESAKELKRAELEKAELLTEIRQLRQALEGITRLSVYIRKEYLNTPPKEALSMLKDVEALAELDPTALRNAAHMSDYWSDHDTPRKINAGKKRLQAHTSGTHTDTDTTPRSSLPSLPKHHLHKALDGFGSDGITSRKEESVAHVHIRTHRGGSIEVCPVNTN